MSGEDRNTKLMKEMGSPTGNWNPEAPDQNLFVLNRGKEAILVVAAWVKAHTSERIPGSPFCVDKKGNSVYVEKLAKDTGWTIPTARNELAAAAAAGLCRVEKGKRIWQCADIPLAHQPREKKPPKAKGNTSVQMCWPTQLIDSIEKLPDEKRSWLEAKYGEYLSWKPKFFSDVMAAARVMDERVENNIFSAVGISSKPAENGATKKPRKNAHQPSVQLELKLLAEPTFVQMCGDETSVQSCPATSVQVENGEPSFSVFRPLKQQTGGPPPPAVKGHVVVVEKLKAAGIGWVRKDAAQKILDDCRKLVPDCTVEEVAAIAAAIAPKINLQTQKNPPAVLISIVPKKLKEFRDSAPAPKPTKEEKAIQDAKAVLANPDAGFDTETIEWAKGVIEAKTKGAGS